ncbi:MAG: acetyl-CoA carboxylase, carboxyltransferase subunit beta [Nitrospinae bacterium]|nr:acetyl-CoA carboxylase, carboxyltransferase subunit beta [Nitrospinota bacterium]
MSWLEKIKSTAASLGKKLVGHEEEAWVECKRCMENAYQTEIAKNLYVCPKCGYHFRIDAHERIRLILDRGSFVEHDKTMISADPLKFKDKKKYKDRIRTAIKESPVNDAVVCGSGKIGEHPVEVCVFEFKYMGGSMGSVVGEKIARAIERAIQNRSALIIVSCSGGARMQEGVLSLMQMAKTVAALQKLAENRLPYISVLTDPTTGGVSASFAMLGDVVLAEPGATVGFAGPRVIEQTIQQKLPKGFQTAEFLLEHGLIDNLIHRREMKRSLENILGMLTNKPAAVSAN